jgi:GR25 family glycosyltransferase involved in LPS biosynthesis
MKNIVDIKHAYYINLENRKDRKEHVEHELVNIGIKAERFNAIKLENGAIGCSLSHLKCLQNAKENNWDHVLICEDDITFLNKELFINQLNNFFKSTDNWDVILFAGNIIPPSIKFNNYSVKINKCQTTTGYLVKGHYIPILIENIKTGLNNLIKNPDKHSIYAIDKYWFKLQQKDKWFLITPLTVVQKPGYSDIEKKNTNYQNIMTDLYKPYLVVNKNI